MAKLYDMDVDDYLYSTVNLEPLAIEEEFVRLPADLAYWNMRYAKALEALLRAKRDRDLLERRHYMEGREILMGKAREAADTAASEAADMVEGGKKKASVKVSVKAPTVGDIESYATTHPEVLAAREAEIVAEVEKVKLQGIVDAVRAKKDMLIQVGARQRTEMESDPSLREQARVAGLKREGLG